MIRLALFLLLWPGLLLAGQGMYPVPMVYQGGGSTYPDIVFYHDANSLATTPNKGTTAITFGSGILLNTSTPITGTGSWDNNNDGYDRITIPSDYINWENARIGFYFRPCENSAGTIVGHATDTANFRLGWNDSTRVVFDYKNQISTPTHGMVTDCSTAYFVEVELYGTGAKLYIDGVLKSTLSGATGTITGNMMLGTSDGNQWDGHYDQLIISDDNTRDIYAIRNNTSF